MSLSNQKWMRISVHSSGAGVVQYMVTLQFPWICATLMFIILSPPSNIAPLCAFGDSSSVPYLVQGWDNALSLCAVLCYSLPRTSRNTLHSEWWSSQCCSLMVNSICQWCLEVHIWGLLDKWKHHCPQTNRHVWTDTWTPSCDRVHSCGNSLSQQYSLPSSIHEHHVQYNPK